MERINLLGVQISAINMDQALFEFESWIHTKQSHYVCVTPIHAVMDCYDQPQLREIYNHSGLTTPDGMPVVWWLRLHGKNWVRRVYGPDLMLALCAYSVERGYRHYFYGGTPEVLDSLDKKLKNHFPGIKICGTCSPPFRQLTDDEDQEIINQINQANPDIVWVGIGSPKQEYWMADHINQLNRSVLIGVGAAFDFISGFKPQAPIWMQRSGLEWLFRLLSEPKRLWKRYVLGYPRFLVLLFLYQLGLLKLP